MSLTGVQVTTICLQGGSLNGERSLSDAGIKSDGGFWHNRDLQPGAFLGPHTAG